MDGQTDGQSENYRALASKQEINIHSVFMFFFCNNFSSAGNIL